MTTPYGTFGVKPHGRLLICKRGELRKADPEYFIVGGNWDTQNIEEDQLSHIARWDGTTFQPIAGGFNAQVSALGLEPETGELVAGGLFTATYDEGTTLKYIAQCHPDPLNPGVFNWVAMGDGLDLDCNDIIQNGHLTVAGQFQYADNVEVNRIGQWDGSTFTAFGTGTNAVVDVCHMHNDELVIGGQFTQADGNTCNYIARWDGSTFVPYGTGMNDRVTALGTWDGKLVVGGDFTVATGNVVGRVAYWDENQSLFMQIGSGADAIVWDLLQVGNDLVMTGAFTSIPDAGISRWDGSNWNSYGAGLTGGTHNGIDLINYNNSFIVVGAHLFANGVLTKGVAYWNGSTFEGFKRGVGLFDYGFPGVTHCICPCTT